MIFLNSESYLPRTIIIIVPKFTFPPVLLSTSTARTTTEPPDDCQFTAQSTLTRYQIMIHDQQIHIIRHTTASSFRSSTGTYVLSYSTLVLLCLNCFSWKSHRRTATAYTKYWQSSINVFTRAAPLFPTHTIIFDFLNSTPGIHVPLLTCLPLIRRPLQFAMLESLKTAQDIRPSHVLI